jgi:uncharacterized RDD family membrane protein YckC
MDANAVLTEDEFPLEATGTDGVPVSPTGAALRQAASERLAAHRQKRAAAREALQEEVHRAAARAQNVRSDASRGAARIREAVAARYQASPSYRDFLAEEAQRALAKAQAEAEIARRNAEAMAEAQMQLMAEMEQWDESRGGPAVPAATHTHAETAQLEGAFAGAMADIAVAATESLHLKPRLERSAHAGLTVRLYEDLPAASAKSNMDASRALRPMEDGGHFDAKDLDAGHLDEEIAFRLSPEFAPPASAAEAIPGNVIEFPRQLVAARKARPRIAEGPLREEAPLSPQLRIFEVEPEQISPAPTEPASAPVWQDLVLEAAAPPTTATVDPMIYDHAVHLDAAHSDALAPASAPLPLRLMAMTVDACCIAAAVIVFATTAAAAAGPRIALLPVPAALGLLAATTAVFWALFQTLFFTLSERTPGMRYAGVGFCTFADRQPTRRALRFRILATVFAAAPLGLGIVWAWMDEDRLGWHDRMSRMYLRESDQ